MVELLPDFRGKIAETQQALSTAKLKPKAADQLRAIALRDISEYFKENETTIVTFFEVNKQPREYLRILSEVFAVGDISSLPIGDLQRGLQSFLRLRETGAEQLMRAVGVHIVTMLSEKIGLSGNQEMSFSIISDGRTTLYIFYPNGSIKDYTSKLEKGDLGENFVRETVKGYLKENHLDKCIDVGMRIASKGDNINKTQVEIYLRKS
jgi:hypothetical protein